MKQFSLRPTACAIGAMMLACSVNFAYAQDEKKDDSAASNNDSLIQKISAKIKAQESTIDELKAEVNALKTQKTETPAKPTTTQNTPAASSTSHLLELGASPVITAPYLGVPPRWDASDLIVNFPTYNEDVLLMQRDVAIDQALKDKGLGTPVNPLLELSGTVQAQSWATKPFSGRSQSDIDLTDVELDFSAHVSDWVNGLATLVYDNSAPNASGSTNAQLVTNSRVYVEQAFLTVGNLNKSPFYGTIGQRTLPFGHYSSYMISNTYPQSIFKIRDRALLFGYYPMTGQLGPYATAFVFKGDTKVGGGANNINNYGADLGYLFCHGNVSGDFGFSGIANIADSLGMQNNGITNQAQFRGYGFAPTSNPNATENLVRRVPGLNVHAKLGIGDWTLLGEANTATSRFAGQDMSFNGAGAKPAAMHSEIAYSFNIGAYPSSIAAGYDHTWQALALSIPQSRYITAFNTSILKDTIESLEFKRELNYGPSDSAGGQNTPVYIFGHYSNTFTAQIGYYF